MVGWFGTDLLLVAMVMLAGSRGGIQRAANIPVVAAMVLLVKGYFVAAELVPEMALGPAFTAWPASTLPVFVAMMFAGTRRECDPHRCIRQRGPCRNFRLAWQGRYPSEPSPDMVYH